MADEQNKVSAAGSTPKKMQFRGATRREVAAFSRELSVLIDVGMPLLKALRILARRVSNHDLSMVISEVAANIERGSTLSDALSKHPKLFDKLFINVVKVGEVGGVLDQSLRRLANFLEEQARIRNKVFYALMYPCTVVFLSFVALCVIVGWVVPQFMAAFPDVSKLPTPTRIVYGWGLFLESYWWLVLIGLVVLVIVFKMWKNTLGGRQVVDRLKLKLPIVGRFGTKVVTERVTTTFATLLRSGVQILDALKIVGATAGNVIVEQAFLEAAAKVERGENLAETLEKANIFPPSVVDMIAIGDEAGALDVVLEKVSTMLKEEIDYALDGLTSLLEPILIIVLGIVIIFIALSVYLPYWKLGQQVFG